MAENEGKAFMNKQKSVMARQLPAAKRKPKAIKAGAVMAAKAKAR